MKFSFDRRGGWIRVGRAVFIITREPPLFSERMGYRKYVRIGFGWRVRLEWAKEPA